jgi:hypothetical protein
MPRIRNTVLMHMIIPMLDKPTITVLRELYKLPEVIYNKHQLISSAELGYLDLIKHYKVKLTDMEVNLAAENGHLDILKWHYQISNKRPSIFSPPHISDYRGFHISIAAYAAIGNQLHVLEWLHKKKANFYRVIDTLSFYGNLYLIKILYDWGYNDMTETACYGAALGNHYETFKWLIDHDCHFNTGQCLMATKNYDIIKFILGT